MLFYKAFIIGAFVLNLVVSTLLSIYFVQHEMNRALIATIVFTLIVVIIAVKLRKKILFSTVIIKIGSQMMRSTPSIWIVYMFMLTLNSVVMCSYFIILYTSYLTWKDDVDPNLKYYIGAFLIFSGYYLAEIFQNSTQVVVGAIVAKWYYESDVKTVKAIENTFFKCFGSICLGSLFSSIFSILKEVAILMKPSDKILQYPLLKPIWKAIQLIIFCLNYTLKYFNNYSFAYISIHSTGYIKASLKMYKLYCNKGYNTLISECIINLILKLYIVFSGISGAVISYLCLNLIQPEFTILNPMGWLLVLASALLAMQISRMIALIINAYVYPEPSVINENDTLAETPSFEQNATDTTNIGAQPYEYDAESIDSNELVGNNNGDDDDNDDFDIQDDDVFVSEEDRFTVAKPVWNDTKFGIFFLIVAILFFITSMRFIIKYTRQFVEETPSDSQLPIEMLFEFKTIFLLFCTLITSFAISIAMFLQAGKNSTKFTYSGLKFICGIFILGGVSSIILGQLLQAIFFGGLASIIIVLIKKYQPMIDLAANILQIVISVVKRYPQTAIAALVGFFSTLLFTAILKLSVSCAYIAYGFHGDGTPKFDNDGNQISIINTSLVITILFLNFAGLYIIDVLKNILHVTIAGFYGTWYYLESTFTGMPNNEGFGSFKRSITYSFGTICLGSIFVIIFQCFAVFMFIGDKNLGFIGVLSDFVLKITSFAVGYFNTYAFSFVALYGANMLTSARSTFIFFKQRGKQAAINDTIISFSLSFYCIVAGLISMIVSAVILFILSIFIRVGDNAYMPLMMYSFLISFNVALILIQTTVSGSSAFFFALNKDPAVFEESHPFEFQEISRCYPRVLEKLDLQMVR
ncbi:hypothetical protein CANINC_001638 [Pichia inconspicua]|uniref:Protein PNS1 n=1 Tax=Pichia inconspicua TaxID=52247 RepID=A0A4T0X389_9ASCO|nr:hypothetical protein CANINC_001638 [[Candida] inconspicua]